MAAPAEPIRPATEDMLTMAPGLPCLSIWRISYLRHSQVPLRLMLMTESQSCSDCSIMGFHCPSMPALLKARSRRPNVSTVFWIRDWTSEDLETSDFTNRPSPPAARTRLMVSLPSASRRPETTTFAPFFAKRMAVSRPMPVVPPVISAAFPSRSPCDCVLINSPSKSFVNGGATFGFEVYIANGNNNRVFVFVENGVSGNFGTCPGNACVGMGNLDLEHVVCFDAELCESHLRTLGATAGILIVKLLCGQSSGGRGGIFRPEIFPAKTLRRVGEFGTDQLFGFGFSPAPDCGGCWLASDDPVPPNVFRHGLGGRKGLRRRGTGRAEQDHQQVEQFFHGACLTSANRKRFARLERAER